MRYIILKDADILRVGDEYEISPNHYERTTCYDSSVGKTIVEIQASRIRNGYKRTIFRRWTEKSVERKYVRGM